MFVTRAPVRWGRRRRVAVAGAVAGGAFAAAGMLVGLCVAFVQLSWPHQEPAGNPELGINFECDQAEYLLLEDPRWGQPATSTTTALGRAEWCAATVGQLLDETRARRVRVSIEWSEVEPEEGVYDFRLLDALLDAAGQRGATVLLGVGIKGERHPEYYIPDWLLARVKLTDGQDVAADPDVRASRWRWCGRSWLMRPASRWWTRGWRTTCPTCLRRGRTTG